ncbi:penicillin-binding transpeptidase domain-containing protein [Streptomyces sp. CWNU-52B]|uniref:penicillin-binding transpeptidase domain-containing protein n=1 Tax=unclassified Streptomyces TaxID=2593676 RepID=UPI0039C4C33F
MGNRRRAPERGRSSRMTGTKTKPAVIGGMIAVVVGGAGLGGYALFGGGAAADEGSAAGKESVKSGPLSAAEVKSTATAFLTAWQSGNVRKASSVTTDTTAAAPLLTGYGKEAYVKDVTLTAKKRTGDVVPFSVKGTVTYKGLTKPLAYESELTVVRRAKDGKPLVDWHAAVVHPDLEDGDKLVTGEAGTPPVKALDRDGGELTTATYPSLGTVLDGLREKFGKTAGGKAGVELRVIRAGSEDSDGGKGKSGEDGKNSTKSADADKNPDKTLLELSKGTPGTVRTTLSPALQATAEKEVASKSKASAVIMRPSTGEILAVANSGHGFNTAFQGSLAPGSTMKIITASLLIDKGLASVNEEHPCPKYSTYGGWKFQNDDKFQIKGGTFKASFARSCNTAFISQAKELSDDDLTKQAQQVFGLGRDNWAIGVPTFDGSVPVQSQAQMAASLIGQGGVRMNPLNMASVVATAKTGTFHQPYLVSPDVDDRTLAKASRSLSASTQSQLKELLQYTAAAGTAAEAMAGLGPDFGAKTGSAEVDNQKKPNGWFTAWKGDLAAAGVVQQGGHGGDTAGPIVAALLKAGS